MKCIAVVSVTVLSCV